MGSRGRRKPKSSAAYENLQQTAIAYRMLHYGLTEIQAKHEKAATELGRLWLSGQITAIEREAGEMYLELYENHLRAIKAPIGLRKTNASGDGGDIISLEYVEWAIAAEAKWAVFEVPSVALRTVVLEDRMVGGMMVSLRAALRALAVRFGLLVEEKT